MKHRKEQKTKKVPKRMHDAKKDLEGKSELFLDRVTSVESLIEVWSASKETLITSSP